VHQSIATFPWMTALDNVKLVLLGTTMSDQERTAHAYVSLLFAIVVALYGIFTRNLMDIARKKYVVEEGVFAA
jgi:ABC-type taurine transport system ATPase subunit